MSACVRVGDRELRLSRREGQRGYWVRLAATGRTLGVIVTSRSRWTWRTWPLAFRGDGRPGHETDGHHSDRVPDGLEGHGERLDTRQAACDALIAYLDAQRAPALGHGPHAAVVGRATA